MIIKQITLKEDFGVNEALVLTIGAFDGIHLGHRRLFNELQKEKLNNNYKSAVLTFLKHPDFILHKREDGVILDRSKSHFDDFEALGIDYIFLMDSEILSLTYEAFHEKVLNKFNVRKIIVGDEFRYGKGALGSVKTLKEAYDVSTFLVMNDKGTKISSTDIRALLRGGDIKKTNELLGYNYSFKTSIKEVKGNQIILNNDNKILLPSGSYSIMFKYNSVEIPSILVIEENELLIKYDWKNDYISKEEVEIVFK